MSSIGMRGRAFMVHFGILLFAAYSTTLHAQVIQPPPGGLNTQLAEDVKQAANRARVAHDDRLTRAFSQSAERQPRAFADAYRMVPSEARTASMADYLIAKTGGGFVVAADLKDFHWGYVERKLRFYSARLESTRDYNAVLKSVEVGGMTYDFGTEGQPVRDLNTIVLPSSASSVDYVTVSFGVGKAKAFWTGLADAGAIAVVQASTSAGCEIHVYSEPTGAAVYFNGKEWHRKTDTKSVRDPNEYDVLVRLPGFKDWREKRKLSAGDSWVIRARLKK